MKKTGMKPAKVGALFLVAVMAMAAVGASYAHWQDILVIKGDITMDDMDVRFMDFFSSDPFDTDGQEGRDQHLDPSDCSFDGALRNKDIGYTKVSSPDHQTLKIEIGDAYPCYYSHIKWQLENHGSVPALLQHKGYLLQELSIYSQIIDIEDIELRTGHDYSVMYTWVEGDPDGYYEVTIDVDVDPCDLYLYDFTLTPTGFDLLCNTQLDPIGWNTPEKQQFHMQNWGEYLGEIDSDLCIHFENGCIEDAAYDFKICMTWYNWPHYADCGGCEFSKTWTLDADFDEGTLVGVEHETVHDQLQLSSEQEALPFLWVPNQGQGTVSKIDTVTGDELGRYHVAPHTNGVPSRTTVDLYGNCWVGVRRGGTVVKIGLLEGGVYIDRNGNGVADTSRDLDMDGSITGAELLPFGQDECVLFEVLLRPGFEGTYVPGTVPSGYYEMNDWGQASPRGLAVDSSNNLWAGICYGYEYYYIDGNTGAILDQVDTSAHSHVAYGAVIDGNGILWSSGWSRDHVLRLDPSTKAISILPLGHFSYGMGLDGNDQLFVSGYDDRRLTRIDVNSGTIDWTHIQNELYQARGVAVTPADNHVWVVSTANDRCYRYDNNGVLLTPNGIYVGDGPTGVAVDAAGKVWVCNLYDDTVVRIDPATNSVDLTKHVLGSGGHYSYSDMTGILVRSVTTKTGTWTVDYDSGVSGAAWGVVSWNSNEPAGTSVTVRVRSSSDGGMTWSGWETVSNGTPLSTTPDGQILQIEVTLQITSGDVSPILYDLTASGTCS